MPLGSVWENEGVTLLFFFARACSGPAVLTKPFLLQYPNLKVPASCRELYIYFEEGCFRGSESVSRKLAVASWSLLLLQQGAALTPTQ